MKKVKPYLIKYWWVLFLVLFLSIFAKSLIFVLLVLVGGLNQLYKRIIPFPLGLDFTTFIVVVIFFSYGWFWAFIAVILILIIGAFVSGQFNHVPIVRLAKFVVVLMCCFVLFNFGVVSAGKIATVIAHLSMLIVSFFMIGPLVVRAIPAFFIGVFLNFFLFNRFGELLVDIVSGL